MTLRKIRMLISTKGVGNGVAAGDVIEVSEKDAEHLVAAKAAEYVEEVAYIATIPPQLWDLGPRFIKVKAREKIPVENWTDPKNQYGADDPRLIEWLTQGGNYGIIGGHGLIIIDADDSELKDFCVTTLPATFTVETGGGGLHLYYRSALEKPIRLRGKDGDNIGDVQATNKFVVGANCIHPNGNAYRVVNPSPVAELSEEALRKALDPYILKREKIEASQKEERSFPSFDIAALVPPGFIRQGDEYYGPHPVHGSKNGRNLWINVVSGEWSCFRCGTGGGAYSLLAVLEGIIRCEDAVPGALRGEVFKKVKAKAIEKGLIKARNFTKIEDGTKKPDIGAILDYFKKNFLFKTPDDIEELYVYEDGIYRPGETRVRAEVEELLGDSTNTHFVSEVIGHLVRRSYCKRAEFNVFDGRITVENGLLDLFTMKLGLYDPDRIFTFKIRANYDVNKDCPRFKKFLKEILPEEDDRKLIQEYAGYCLYPGMPFHKILFLYGTGRNGKGTLVRTIEDILGRETVSSIPLDALDGSQRFALANLFGKLMNVCSEPPTRRVFQTELLKKVCGQDLIDAEVKNKQNPLRFVNMAKFWVMGNKFPRVNDPTLSWWDRILIISFNQTFTQEQGNMIPDYERTWLNDADERAGILNWMLDGLKRLMDNRGFTQTKTMREMMIQFKRVSDSIGAFIEEVCEIGSGECTREEAFAAYRDYAYSIGAYPEGERTFSSRIRLIPGVSAGKKRIRGENLRIWKGLSLKDGADGADGAHGINSETLDAQKYKVENSAPSAPSAPVEDRLVPIDALKEPNLEVEAGAVCWVCNQPIREGDRWTLYKGRKVHLPDCYHKASEEATP